MKRFAAVLSAVLLITGLYPTVNTHADSAAFTFNYEIINNSVEIRGIKGECSSLAIPDTIDGLPVASIAEGAFANEKSLNSVTLPDSIVSVGDKAFSNCGNLKNVYIGSSADYIGEYAFSACPQLECIDVSEKNPIYCSFDGSLYKNNEFILYAGGKNAVIREGTHKIAKRAFFGKTDLSSVSIPDSVTVIGDYAFSGCLSLEYIIIPDSVETLGDACFLSCTSLKDVNIGSSVGAISDKCFHSCSRLNNVVIPDSVSYIGSYAFFSCDSLGSLYIPSGVEVISANAVGMKYNIRSAKDEPASNFTVYGKKGSSAEKYASSHNLPFINGVEIYGDVNCDSSVDAMDSSIVLTEYAFTSSGMQPSFSEMQTIAADYTHNGKIDAQDASSILTYYAVSSASESSSV